MRRLFTTPAPAHARSLMLAVSLVLALALVVLWVAFGWAKNSAGHIADWFVRRRKLREFMEEGSP